MSFFRKLFGGKPDNPGAPPFAVGEPVRFLGDGDSPPCEKTEIVRLKYIQAGTRWKLLHQEGHTEITKPHWRARLACCEGLTHEMFIRKLPPDQRTDYHEFINSLKTPNREGVKA